MPVDLHIVSYFQSLRALILRDPHKLLSMKLLLDVVSFLPHLHTLHYQSPGERFFDEEVSHSDSCNY